MMVDHGLSVLFALFLWWFSTGLILYLDGLPRRTYLASLGCGTVVLVIAVVALGVTRGDQTIVGAYVAFTSALLIWGWHEFSFLTGLLTGPRKTDCPAGVTQWRRFRHATGTLIYHEVAIAVTALGLIALTWGAANQVGAWTFTILWLARLSTKLNIFLGVPNITEAFLPAHLGHLKTYFGRKPMNLLFPLSVTLATGMLCLLIHMAWWADTGAEAIGFTFLATLLGLALAEHWFLVLPLPVERLWAWGMRSHDPSAQADGASTGTFQFEGAQFPGGGLDTPAPSSSRR